MVKQNCTAKTNNLLSQTRQLLTKLRRPGSIKRRRPIPKVRRINRPRVFVNSNRRRPKASNSMNVTSGIVTGGNDSMVPVNAGNTMSTGSSTIKNLSNVMNNLAVSNYKSAFADPHGDTRFIHCRLNPFNTEGSLGIPDGSQIRKFVVDYRQFADITFTGSSGPIDLLFTPTLPAFAYVKVASPNVMNISSPSGNFYNYPLVSTTFGSTWYPFMYPNELSPTTSTNPISAVTGVFKGDVPSIYGATKSRIVTIAHKIYYTGQASLSSNTITVTQCPIEIVEGELSLNNSLMAVNNNRDNASSTAGISTVNTIPGSFNYVPTTLSKGSVSSRVELGSYIQMQHSSAPDPNVYRWVPNYDAPVFVVSTANNTPIFGSSATTGPPPAVDNYGGLTSFDFDWTPVVARISAGVSGQSYRVESVYCVEYQLSQTSPYERAAVRGENNPIALKAATLVGSKIPVSVPVSVDPGNWVSQAADIAVKVGSAVTPFLKFLL